MALHPRCCSSSWISAGSSTSSRGSRGQTMEGRPCSRAAASRILASRAGAALGPPRPTARPASSSLGGAALLAHSGSRRAALLAHSGSHRAALLAHSGSHRAAHRPALQVGVLSSRPSFKKSSWVENASAQPLLDIAVCPVSLLSSRCRHGAPHLRRPAGRRAPRARQHAGAARQTCEQNCAGCQFAQVWLPSAASCAALVGAYIGITSPYPAPPSLLPMRQVINYDQLGVHFRYNEILKEYLK